MELKRRFANHPNKHLLSTTKKLSYWSNADCIKFADELNIDYSDVVKLKKFSTYNPNHKHLYPLRELKEGTNNIIEVENKLPPPQSVSLITFRIQTTNGTIFPLRMFSDASVRDIKNKLTNEFAVVELPQQKIFQYRKELDDDQTLSKLGISNGDCLALGCNIQIFYVNFFSQTKSIIINECDYPSILVKAIAAAEGIQQNIFHLSFAGCLFDAVDEPLHTIGLVPLSTIHLVSPTLEWTEASE